MLSTVLISDHVDPDDCECSGVLGVAVHTLLEGSGEYSYVPSSFETDRSYSFLKVYVMIIIIDIMEKMMIVVSSPILLRGTLQFLILASFDFEAMIIFGNSDNFLTL